MSRLLVIVLVLFGWTNLLAQEFTAHVTYYTNDPRYGKKTASGKLAVQGVTVAASKDLPFGTRLYIPELSKLVGGNGTFVVQDRGSAVQSRRASRGKLPVIDIYVNSHSQVQKLKRAKRHIFKVITQ